LPKWEAYKIVLAVKTRCDNGLQVLKVLACIEEESKFNCGVVGDDGNSLGLMQVQWRYRRHIAKEVLRLDTSTNIREGVKYLRAVGWNPAAYNAGKAGAKRGKGKPHAIKVKGAEERILKWISSKDFGR